MLYTVEILLRI